MSKYIDAEKLKEKIQPHYENAKKRARYAAQTGTSESCARWDEAVSTYEFILYLINSLQQEHQEVDLVAELKHHLTTTPKEQLEKEWKELEHWNNIGPTVQEFLYGKQPKMDLFERPETPIKEAIEVTSRMQHIDDDIKPIAEFILDYASWNLHKDEWNQPVIEVPLFRVLDALVQRGKPYCCAG